MSSHVLSVHNVTKVFPMGDRDVHVLSGITFDVQPGEFVTIMGPSGCGKSTLLHLLSGLDRPTSGDVRIDGQSIVGLNRRKTTRRRRKIGFIFQFFNLLPHLTVHENIAMPLLTSGKRPAAARDHLEALIRWGRPRAFSQRRRHRARLRPDRHGRS